MESKGGSSWGPGPFDRVGLAVLWTALALLSLPVVVATLDTSVPVFHAVWLLVPLLALVRSRDPDSVGFRWLEPDRFLRATAMAGAAYAALLVVFEPTTGVYDRLLYLAVEAPDPTFAWVVRFDGGVGWVGLVLFSGFVTLYSEELFFRGWLLQWLERRRGPRAAVLGQALAFTLLQSIPAFFFGPVRAVVYLVVYAFGLGVVVGTVAQRTGSIWPGLVVVTVANAVLTVLLV